MRILLTGLISILLLPASASAALRATVTVASTETTATTTAVVTGTSRIPSRVTVTFGKTTLVLKRVSGNRTKSTWRSGSLTGGRRNTVVAARTGRVIVKLTITGRVRKLTTRSTEAAGQKAPAGQTEAPAGAPQAPPATPGASSLFGTPASKLTGNEAASALQQYIVDSRFTDCVPGWPNCAVEQRYGIFSSGDHYYCRLTSNSGSDINSYGSNLTLTGAEQDTTGAWAVSYTILTYTKWVNYRWDVSATGAAVGQYWGPGVSVAGTPTEVITGMQWVRGARDCSY